MEPLYTILATIMMMMTLMPLVEFLYGAHDDALIYGNMDLEDLLHNNGTHDGSV